MSGSGSSPISDAVPAPSTNAMPRSNGGSLFLQNSDAPNMKLTSMPLLGIQNYLPWSRAVKLALGAKRKLGFINGTEKRPDVVDPAFEEWERVDCMVTSWLLHSISDELHDAFLFADSARKLWCQLEDLYGLSNGPLLYQLQREVASISQGSSSVSQYYTRLKKLWDELGCLIPSVACRCTAATLCTCNLAQHALDYHSLTKLMQFLMGLNDSFEAVRSQILGIEPLPLVEKAYSMVLRVEKQKEIQVSITDVHDHSAMYAKQPSSSFSKPYHAKEFKKKSDRVCDHCQHRGHTRDSCFKLVGVPEWYKEFKENKGASGHRNSAHAVDVLPHNTSSTSSPATPQVSASFQNDFYTMMRHMMSQDMMKHSAQPLQEIGRVNFSHFGDFAGPTD